MKVLDAVYRTGSVTAAARIIHVTQPAISKTIKLVEEMTGLALFENINSRLVPTGNLHALIPQVRRILLEQSKIGQRIGDLREGRIGLIRIASAPTLIHAVLSEAIRRLKLVEPNAEFSISTASTRQIVEQVANEEVDIGICQPSSFRTSVNGHQVWLGQVICVMPKSHALSDRPFVTPHDLAEEETISYSATEPTAARISEAFLESGIIQRKTIEVDVTIGACSLVASGLGVALLSSVVDLQTQFPNLCSRPFVPDIAIQAYLFTSSIRKLTPLSEKFCEKLMEVGREKSLPLGS
jgi:DNA-binding transcriptional LysR family regulator